MKRFSKRWRFFVVVLALTCLAACTCDDREERLVKLRGVHGADAIGAVAEEEQLSAGARLYRDKTCNTCHGDDGIKPLLPDYPVLARQGQEYALQQMKDIQSGSRTNGDRSAGPSKSEKKPART